MILVVDIAVNFRRRTQSLSPTSLEIAQLGGMGPKPPASYTLATIWRNIITLMEGSVRRNLKFTMATPTSELLSLIFGQVRCRSQILWSTSFSWTMVHGQQLVQCPPKNISQRQVPSGALATWHPTWSAAGMVLLLLATVVREYNHGRNEIRTRGNTRDEHSRISEY